MSWRTGTADGINEAALPPFIRVAAHAQVCLHVINDLHVTQPQQYQHKKQLGPHWQTAGENDRRRDQKQTEGVCLLSNERFALTQCFYGLGPNKECNNRQNSWGNVALDCTHRPEMSDGGLFISAHCATHFRQIVLVWQALKRFTPVYDFRNLL